MKTNLHKELSKGNIASHVSEQYSPVNTQLFLQPFLERGWKVVKTQNSTSKKTGTIHRELVSLHHDDFISSHGNIELKVVNSYDARSSLKIYAGIHRLVCSNGLVMMVEGEQFRFVHRGEAIYEKLDNAYDRIVAYLDTVKLRTEKLENTTLDDTQLDNIITNIARKVFEKDTDKENRTILSINPYTLKNIKRVRRNADKGTDAFTLLNVIQENITRKGDLSAMVSITNKETKETRIEHKSKNRTENRNFVNDIKLNQIIVEEFLKEVA